MDILPFMRFVVLFLATCLFIPIEVDAADSFSKFKVYQADITAVPGTDSIVSGTAVIYTGDTSVLGYGGFVSGLEANLNSSNCPAKNGCGVHIHSGKDCFNDTTQEDHYFVDPVTIDPWIVERYSSDDAGNARFASIIDIGTDDVVGRTFLVHAEDGSRVGCGILELVSDDDLLVARTEPLMDSGVFSDVTVLALDGDQSGRLCYFGLATGLEPNLLSFQANGSDCSDSNGCGTHIHAGTDCFNSTTQMGHFYNEDTLETDPWLLAGYLSTEADGSAYYMDCFQTDELENDNRAFLVHANNGSRVSCGLLLGRPTSSSGNTGVLSSIMATVMAILVAWTVG